MKTSELVVCCAAVNSSVAVIAPLHKFRKNVGSTK